MDDMHDKHPTPPPCSATSIGIAVNSCECCPGYHGHAWPITCPRDRFCCQVGWRLSIVATTSAADNRTTTSATEQLRSITIVLTRQKPSSAPWLPHKQATNFFCPTTPFRQPLQIGGNHQERLDSAKGMQVPAIPERLTPKLDEVNDVSSFGDVFQCYRWRQLCVINPPMNFSSASPGTTASPAAWTRGGGRLRLSRAARPTAAMDFRRSNAGSTSCLSCGRGGQDRIGVVTMVMQLLQHTIRQLSLQNKGSPGSRRSNTFRTHPFGMEIVESQAFRRGC